MKKVIALSILLLNIFPCFAQTDPIKDEIGNVIIELFNAYRAGDSTRVGKLFTKDAKLQSIYLNGDGEAISSELKPVTIFTSYIGNGLDEVHDEKLWDTQIFVDKIMATVWTRYAFFLGEKFTHCGTETFLLRKVKGKWKIFLLVDTRQTTGCQVPKNLK